MATSRVLPFLMVAAVALTLGSAQAEASCSPGECCISPYCCEASVGLCSGTCMCSYTCGGGQASCICGCRTSPESDTPELVREPADIQTAIPLGQLVGFKITGGTITLEELTILMQNATRWTVQVEPAVAAVVVRSGILEGPLVSVLQEVGETYGVQYSLNARGKTVTFLAP